MSDSSDSASSGAAWTGEEADLVEGRSLSLEQQLELVGRVRALEAELAQARGNRALTPTEQLDAEQQVLALRESLPWRVGRAVTIPVRAASRIFGRPRAR